MIESQVNYIVGAISHLRRGNIKSLEIRADVLQRFNEGLQQMLKNAIWGTGCRSWYLDRNGRNTTLWPGYTFRFRKLTRRFDVTDYQVESSGE
jgi:hypothetical protein